MTGQDCLPRAGDDYYGDEMISPYGVAFFLKWAMRNIAAHPRLTDAQKFALAESAAAIIDYTFEAQFGPGALHHDNPHSSGHFDKIPLFAKAGI